MARTFQHLVVPLDKIRFEKDYQSRDHASVSTIAEYKQLWLDADDDKPYPFRDKIILFFDGQWYWPGDGWHRCKAAIEAGLTEVPADVADGTAQDALVKSCGSNIDHGLPRTRKDKWRSVTVILTLYPKKKQADVARYCGVSRQFVASVKEELDRKRATQSDGEKVNNNHLSSAEHENTVESGDASEPAADESPSKAGKSRQKASGSAAASASQSAAASVSGPTRPRTNQSATVADDPLAKLDESIDGTFSSLIRMVDRRLDLRSVKGSSAYYEACIEKLREFRNLLGVWREKA